MTALHLRLPATSANLGPGFDAVALAMNFFLDLEASPAAAFAIEATGRNPELVGSLEGNLILDTYLTTGRDLVATPTPLKLKIRNEIPLGMGCGSSAAALLAGVMLANHFGGLHLSADQILEEACRREGHPDNVAACFHGALTVSSMQGGRVTTATLGQLLPWRLLVALPQAGLATKAARALLPDRYTRAEAIENVQATALLVTAFALNRPDLLGIATRDRMHQPFRSAACPLLPALLPLVGQHGIFSVTLSGAGPAVLLICAPESPTEAILAAMRQAVGDPDLRVLEALIASGASAHD